MKEDKTVPEFLLRVVSREQKTSGFAQRKKSHQNIKLDRLDPRFSPFELNVSASAKPLEASLRETGKYRFPLTHATPMHLPTEDTLTKADPFK